jgi:hypothetical protein
MACYCFKWDTGEPVCIGLIPGSVENCRQQCRRRGMGVLCYAVNGDCNSDECSRTGPGVMWVRIVHTTVTLECDGEAFVGPGYGFPVFICSPDEPTHDPFPVGFLIADHVIVRDLFGQEVYGCPTGSAVSSFVYTIAVAPYQSPWVWERSLDHRDPFPLPCFPRVTTKTPCCIRDGSPPCQFITPYECILKCGQPFEGTISWSNSTNPCLGTGNNYPCNLSACCFEPYPTPYPPTDPTGTGNALLYTPFCNVIAPDHCYRLGGHPASNSRSCFRPGGCYGEETNPCFIDGSCVGGLWELVYRPEEHKPPLEKPWLEGSAEIVSAKPERLLEPNGGPQDCKYHYGDVAYRLGSDGYGSDNGSAAGVVCTVKASRQGGDSLNVYNWCPLVYGQDGNARFSCGYRVAEN